MAIQPLQPFLKGSYTKVADHLFGTWGCSEGMHLFS
jgi:hypothetical protein